MLVHQWGATLISTWSLTSLCLPTAYKTPAWGIKSTYSIRQVPRCHTRIHHNLLIGA